MNRTGSTSLRMRTVISFIATSIVCELSRYDFASVMLYVVPKCDLEQCQWEPRPVLDAGSQDDHNSLPGSDLLLSGSD